LAQSATDERLTDTNKKKEHFERHNDWQGSAEAHSAGPRAFGITGSGAAMILFSCDDLK
jgi:hypothetical protein